MSIALLSSTVAELPFALREQITGYAESVKVALPAIFADAGVVTRQDISDQLVFLAGMKKLHSLVASNYWALDNSASLLQSADVTRIRIGSQDYSRGSQLHSTLRSALEAVEYALAREGIKELLDLSYVELVRHLAGNGPR